jgi:hypothetical protein
MKLDRKLVRRGAVLGLVVAAALIACASTVFAGERGPAVRRAPGPLPPSGPKPTPPGSKPTPPGGVSTAAALRQAGWQANVRTSFFGGSFRFRSDGVPRQGILPEYAVPNPGVVVPNETNSHVAPRSEVVKPQHYNFKITTEPRKAAKVTSVFTGPVGVMINGGLVFNPYEGDGETVAMASNFTLKDAAGHEVPFLDECHGHPSPGPVYAYHYHGLPECVTALVDKKRGPSHIIGVAFDGFPIYGDRDIHGRRIKESQLDTCNGITSPTPEFPEGIYHYVLLNVATAHSSIDCFRGEVEFEPPGAKSFDRSTAIKGTALYLCHLPTEGPLRAGRPPSGA